MRFCQRQVFQKIHLYNTCNLDDKVFPQWFFCVGTLIPFYNYQFTQHETPNKNGDHYYNKPVKLKSFHYLSTYYFLHAFSKNISK